MARSAWTGRINSPFKVYGRAVMRGLGGGGSIRVDPVTEVRGVGQIVGHLRVAFREGMAGVSVEFARQRGKGDERERRRGVNERVDGLLANLLKAGLISWRHDVAIERAQQDEEIDISRCEQLKNAPKRAPLKRILRCHPREFLGAHAVC